MVDDDRQAERDRMVAEQLAGRDITDDAVLDAMRRVPRHRYVPDALSAQAYDDYPLPIGHGVTISQPYIVALMTQALQLNDGDRVLEIGTGSGYQAAVLAELGHEVTTIETIEPLADEARRRLEPYGDRVRVLTGDGSLGDPDGAPYDAIIVTAAAPEAPPPLVDQLAVGGRLVIPLGRHVEKLTVLTRTDRRVERRVIGRVRFVPLTGRWGT